MGLPLPNIEFLDNSLCAHRELPTEERKGKLRSQTLLNHMRHSKMSERDVIGLKNETALSLALSVKIQETQGEIKGVEVELSL